MRYDGSLLTNNTTVRARVEEHHMDHIAKEIERNRVQSHAAAQWASPV
jgi:hypothetical protein